RAGAVGGAADDEVASRLRFPGMSEHAEAIWGRGALQLRLRPALAAIEAQLDAVDACLAGEGDAAQLVDAGPQHLAVAQRSDAGLHVDLGHRLHLIGGAGRAWG